MDSTTLAIILLGVVFMVLAVGIIVVKLQTEKLNDELSMFRTISLIIESDNNETKKVSKDI